MTLIKRIADFLSLYVTPYTCFSWNISHKGSRTYRVLTKHYVFGIRVAITNKQTR
jgi:hypothetical protein